MWGLVQGMGWAPWGLEPAMGREPASWGQGMAVQAYPTTMPARPTVEALVSLAPEVVAPTTAEAPPLQSVETPTGMVGVPADGEDNPQRASLSFPEGPPLSTRAV